MHDWRKYLRDLVKWEINIGIKQNNLKKKGKLRNMHTYCSFVFTPNGQKCTSLQCATVNKHSTVWKPPKEGWAFLKIQYFTLQWEINLDAVIQSKAQRLWSMTESWLLSGMSMNQSRLVQSNLWQETTSLWDTPAVHLYAAQHHKQLNSGG